MNLVQLQNTPALGEDFSSAAAASSGRESSGRGLYIGPTFNKQKQEKTHKFNKYINDSFHMEEEEQKERRNLQKNLKGTSRYKNVEQKVQPQKKSLSDDGSMEEYKLQVDDKSSARGSFDHHFKDKFALSKNTVFTQAESSSASNPSFMMQTDFWALSYTKASTKKNYFKNLIYSALQTALFLLLEWLPFIISLHFIGTSNNSSITGGYGMGIVWSNCFIEFIFGGLGLGLQILVMQAIQENKLNMAMNLFKKGIAIVSISMIPLIILMFLSGLIIEGISGNKNLGTYTYQYCTYGLPGFYFNGLYNILKGYFRARKQGMLPLASVAFSAGMSIFWNWLFIFHIEQESEVIGAALARDVTEFINVLILFAILIKKYQKEDKFSLKFTKLAFKGWTELTKFCLPIGGLLLLEWVGYEIFTFQATHLSESEFSAHVILNIFNTVYYQVAYGFSIAITSQVNQEMASQDLYSSFTYSKIGIAIIAVYIFITILPMSFLAQPFSTAFTNDQSTQQSIQDTYALFLTSLAMDAVLAGIVGITRGIGKQKVAAIIFFLSFLVLGQILASIFSYILDGGLVGIWLSILASIFIANFSQILWTGFSDWEKSLIELQSFRQREEKERKKLMLNRVKSRESLIQYEHELDSDVEEEGRGGDKGGEIEQSQTQTQTPGHQNDKYDITQVIVEKEENNNSTINQPYNNTFQMKLNNQNNNSSVFQQNAINSSDKSQDSKIEKASQGNDAEQNENKTKFNIQEIAEEDTIDNSKF